MHQKASVAKLPPKKITNIKPINKDNQQSRSLVHDTPKHKSKQQPREKFITNQAKKAFSRLNHKTKEQNINAPIETPQGHRPNNSLLLKPRRGKEEMIIRATGDSTINILQSTLGQLRKDVQNMAKRKTKAAASGGTRSNPETNRNSKHDGKKNKKKESKLNFNTKERLKVQKHLKSQRRPKAFTGDARINHSTKLSSTFECSENKLPGVYADESTSCQRFFMCHADGRKGIFTCPLGTKFNQKHQVCDWPKKVDCSNSHIYFDI